MMRLMLNAHPRIGVPDETQYFSAIWDPARLERWSWPQTVSRFLDICARLLIPPVEMSQVRASLLELDSADDRALFEMPLSTWAANLGKPRRGEKSPRHIFYADVIHTIFRNARFIQVLRDPRAAVASMNRFEWFHDDTVLNAAHGREVATEGTRRLEQATAPHQRLTLRYEDILGDPECAARAACALLDERFAPEMLEFHETTDKFLNEVHSPKLLQPVGGDPEEWRQGLSEQELAIIETICRRPMREWGYEPAGRRFHAAEHAAIASRLTDKGWNQYQHRASHYHQVTYRPMAGTRARFVRWQHLASTGFLSIGTQGAQPRTQEGVDESHATSSLPLASPGDGAPGSGDERRAASSETESAHKRILSIGLFSNPICGVRDHARLLADELRNRSIRVSEQYGELTGAGSHDFQQWLDDVETASSNADVILLHYSVFSYSWRGVPLSVGSLVGRLSRIGLPVIAILHEFAYPWGRRAWRGFLQAAAQRLALVPLLRVSAEIVVTTEDRRAWIARRPWFPYRRISVAPVFSNIPVVSRLPSRTDPSVVVMGYASEGVLHQLVVEAVAQARREVPGLGLVLVGAPGQAGEGAERWVRAARTAGCPLRFTGVLDPTELSQTLASALVAVFSDESGPSSRKTSLAAFLAHGCPTVALDGARTWPELDRAGAVVLVPPRTGALSRALVRLADDEGLREELSGRAQRFSRDQMSREQTADVILKAVARAVDDGPRKRPRTPTQHDGPARTSSSGCPQQTSRRRMQERGSRGQRNP
jgi:glycosyltransferase involved in cell wall biosynthesis